MSLSILMQLQNRTGSNFPAPASTLCQQETEDRVAGTLFRVFGYGLWGVGVKGVAITKP